MSEAFAHLHVASGFSLRYGASTPATLVERAAAHGPAGARPDRPRRPLRRDPVRAGVRRGRHRAGAGGRPRGLGPASTGRPRTLALPAPSARPAGPGCLRRSRTPGAAERRPQGRANPVRGGVEVDPRHPRVTVLARGQGGGAAPGAGWGRLCRLVTSTHLSGERGAAGQQPGAARRARDRPARPGTWPSPCCSAPPPTWAVPCSSGVPTGPGPCCMPGWTCCHAAASSSRWSTTAARRAPRPASGHAARLLGLAAEAGLPAVLTAAVRHADPGDAVTVDVLDAARRLVPLDPRHLDRVTTAGHLSSTERMRAVAREVTRAAGAGVSGGATAERERADRLLADTVALARACAQDSRTDLGIGAVHLPEPSVLGLSLDRRAPGGARGTVPRCDRHPLPRVELLRSCVRWSPGSRTSSRSSPLWATRPTS